jgi:hypothetical protein
MSQYIHDNTDDEISHHRFLNNYLASKGAEPVDLGPFATLPSSKADGARQIRRLTNLTELTINTSFWSRYRSIANPDFDPHAKFADAVPSLNVGPHTAIPRSNDDTFGSFLSDDNTKSITAHLQAIAFTAGFHFCFIEQGGSSLYPSLAQRVSAPEVLRILLSIGPTETSHFQTWHDKAGNANTNPNGPPANPPFAVFDPVNNSTVTFVDLHFGQPETLQANLIMPEPCPFLNRSFPICSIIRPTATQKAATGAVRALTADGLFIGQSKMFMELLADLAAEADQAQPGQD